MGLAQLLPDSLAFPAPETALRRPNGLLACGGDLSPARLLAAYRAGIFPWYSEPDPILWWSPDPRTVIFPHTLHVPRSLARRLRRGGFRVTLDQAFAAVIHACADGSSIHREGGSWITPAMQAAYTELHRLGHAHSVELWQDGVLAGGVYGVAIGRVFYGESMFSHRSGASSLALVTLAHWLFAAGFAFIDTQVGNPHTARLGAVAIPRRQFLQALSANRDPSPIRDWAVDITAWAAPCR